MIAKDASRNKYSKFSKPFFSISEQQGIEQRYEDELQKVAREIGKLVNNYDPNSVEQMDELVQRMTEYSHKINDWATKTANKFLYQIDKQSKEEWEAHSKRMSFLMKQELLKADTGKALEKYLEDNVKLITSLPLDAAQRIHDIVRKNLYTGEKRADQIAEEILKTENITKARAATIARTEVSRAASGLTMVRSESVDIDWAVWHSTHDIRVRPSHKLMDNVLFQWSDLPNPEQLAGEKKSYGSYLPGGIFNCRCFGQPVIRLDDITFPAKVHRKGSIVIMNRTQFVKEFNIEQEYPLSKAA